MIETGSHNPNYGADRFGFRDLAGVHWSLGAPQLYEHALQRHEAHIAAHGPLVADTGVHTGRSPKDKFVVRDANTDPIVWWDNNNPMSIEHFDALLADFLAHAKGKTLFAQDLYGGADPAFRVKARVFTEYAWHSLFIRNLLIRPPAEEVATFVPDLTIVDLPSFKADPKRHGARSETVIACDFTRKIILIGGSSYAGEMKKSVFTYLNYVLPPQHVMPMHCSANTGKDGDTAIFFGLSGTGKTTLSADPHRTLIGDDEHGWGKSGVFNFEGGCYAKAIKLSREAEPEIYSTTERFGTVMENVTLDPELAHARLRRRFEDRKHPHRLPAAFHRQRLADGARRPAEERHHADLRRVRRAAADRQARSGAGDVSLPQRLYREGGGHGEGRHRAAGDVLDLLRRAVHAAAPDGLRQSACATSSRRHHVDCWLVNTGWTGGKVGVGRRMPIRVTRRLLAAALDGSLHKADFRTDPHFGLAVPEQVPGVEPHILDPIRTWRSKGEFAETAGRLVQMFRDNFKKFEDHTDEHVRNAAPAPRIALV